MEGDLILPQELREKSSIKYVIIVLIIIIIIIIIFIVIMIIIIIIIIITIIIKFLKLILFGDMISLNSSDVSQFITFLKHELLKT